MWTSEVDSSSQILGDRGVNLFRGIKKNGRDFYRSCKFSLFASIRLATGVWLGLISAASSTAATSQRDRTYPI
jgi:hypothetical protein